MNSVETVMFVVFEGVGLRGAFIC